MKNFREVCDEEQSSVAQGQFVHKVWTLIHVGLILPCLYIGLRKYTSIFD